MWQGKLPLIYVEFSLLKFWSSIPLYEYILQSAHSSTRFRYSWIVSTSEMAGSIYVWYMFESLRNWQIAFQSGCTIFISTSNA